MNKQQSVLVKVLQVAVIGIIGGMLGAIAFTTGYQAEKQASR